MDIFLLPFLFHLSSLFFPCASSYTLPDSYFINCGSPSTPSIYGRNYTGDQNPAGKFMLSAVGSSSVSSPSTSDVDLYRTARIFRNPSSYEFFVGNRTVPYVVRFHFYPSPSMGNLSDARFSVSASGFSLLSNFSARGNNFPVIQDFFLQIRSEKLRIDFVPGGGDHSFAFVNAIEVFNTPLNFTPYCRVSREGIESNYDIGALILDTPLRVIHRINVGGPNITPVNDTLLRYWIPDDAYLVSESAASNSHLYPVRPEYQDPYTEFDAPDFVYRTAKTNILVNNSSGSGSGSGSTQSNLTWSFVVKRETDHLVRVHFCDVVTLASNEQTRFILYIYSNFGDDIWPYSFSTQTASPFHNDYVVLSDDSGFLNITVGPNTSLSSLTAFLNGIEIMELVRESAPPSSFGGSDSKRKILLIIVGSTVGAVVVVLIILTAFFVFGFKKGKQGPAEDFDSALTPFPGGSSYYSRTTVRTVSDSPLGDLNLGLKFPFSEILYATKRFNPKLIIGEGGFGKVYKGTLSDGTKIAVKRSEPGHGQGISEFETEVTLLSKIRHHHLVSLMGYCDERDEMILIYEFMEKGTLKDHLYVSVGEEGSGESVSRVELSWDERLRICIGAAKGLNYLHTGSSGSTIIHRDIKSSNILLDGHSVAKVADFGISRSIPLDQTHMSTDVKGSFGYLDPEYFKFMQLTLKSDIYSFGVVLLEVLCARPVIDGSLPREQVNLADWAMTWQKKGEIMKIIDPVLVGRVHPNSLRKFGETVEKCLQEDGANRPNMVDVLWDLEYCLQLQGTDVPREAHEDSMTDVSWGFHLPVIRGLPSDSIEIGEDELHQDSCKGPGVGRDEEGEVFSQLNLDEAR